MMSHINYAVSNKEKKLFNGVRVFSFSFSTKRPALRLFMLSDERTIMDGRGLMAAPLTAMMNDAMGDIQRDPPFQEVFCYGSSLRFGTSLDSNYVARRKLD